MSDFESYPPPFRTVQPPPPTQIAGVPVRDWDDPIPVVDLLQLLDEEYCNNSTSSDNLLEACREWGVFRLVNHGLPASLLNRVQGHARRVFSIPFESKQSLITSPLSYFWGTPALTPAGTALSTSVNGQSINWIEGINVPISQLPQFRADDPVITSFSHVLQEYGKHLGRIGRELFKGMTKNLNLEPAASETNLSESTGFIRVYRYPQYYCCGLKSMNEDAWGMDVHTDSSVLSILNQDDVAGLEVFKSNHWFTVKPIPNTLIVNLGDMMQAISDDEFKSVKHRVKVNKHKERISICYFVFPGEGSVIQSSKYKPFTYSDFQRQVQRDIKTVGFKVGLGRFKLGDE